MGQTSHAQCGEDLIAAFLLQALGVPAGQVQYLDIGCHDPQHLSNSFLFYEAGGSGVAIDGNPMKAARFKQARPRDTVINAMVDATPQAAVPFWVLQPDTLSTGHEAEARRLLASGAARLTQQVMVQRVQPQQVLAQFFPQRAPDLVSVDVEGADDVVVRAVLASGRRPLVFVVETLQYVERGLGRKREDIIALLQQHGYRLYADTYINSLFVDGPVFLRRFNGGEPAAAAEPADPARPAPTPQVQPC